MQTSPNWTRTSPRTSSQPTRSRTRRRRMPSYLLTPRIRAARAYARLLVASADKIGYSQTRSRPMQLGGLHDIPRWADCSSSVTIIYHAAGLRDPNGRAYDGWGYCHEPSARVLTADLRWFPAGDIEIGQELWTLDANLNRGARNEARRRGRRGKGTAPFPP